MAGLIIIVLLVVIFSKSTVVVPQQHAYIVERLGRYSKTLFAGFHILIPFLETVSRKVNLKTVTENLAAHTHTTRDDVEIDIDGAVELQVVDPSKATYSIHDYTVAVKGLANVILRVEIGKIELSKFVDARSDIERVVASEMDKASQNWGVRVLSFEIRNVTAAVEAFKVIEGQIKARTEKIADSVATTQNEMNQSSPTGDSRFTVDFSKFRNRV